MKEKSIKPQKNYGLYLMKIMAMLFIIIHHNVVHGSFKLESFLKNGDVALLPYQQIVLMLLNTIVIVGVNLFFLTSGYCRIRFSWKKVAGILIQVYLIYGVITVFGIAVGGVELSKETLIEIVDAIDTYWFIFVYVVLSIASPFLNTVIDGIDEKGFKHFLILFFAVMCVYGFAYDKTLYIKSGYSFLMAAHLYILGGCLSKLDLKKFIPHRINLGVIYILCVIANTGITFIFSKLNGLAAWHCFAYNNPLIVVESLCLLTFFKDLSITSEKVREVLFKLSSATLMVYLLHSTNWMAGKYEKIPVQFARDKLGFMAGVFFLPVYAVLLYLLCFCVDSVYKKLISFPPHRR